MSRRRSSSWAPSRSCSTSPTVRVATSYARPLVGHSKLYGVSGIRTAKLVSTTAEKVVASFRDRPLDFEPGEKGNYSNSGYLLLGHLIEKISNQTYEQFVRENIFTPLGMKDSGYDSNSRIIPNRASGYSPSPNGPVNAEFIHMTVPRAAGALYCTTEDLLRGRSRCLEESCAPLPPFRR